MSVGLQGATEVELDADFETGRLHGPPPCDFQGRTIKLYKP